MTKANFNACLKIVLEHEGGYVDHPKDPGGATNLGITRRVLAEWRGISPWTNLSKQEVRALGLDEAAAIYRARYWDAVAGDQLPRGLDLVIFDFAVNSGPARAIRYLQAALGTKPDGIVGPATLTAVRDAWQSSGTAKLIGILSARRLGFLKQLNTFPVFGTGWTRRVADTEKRALAMRPASEIPSPQTKGHAKMELLNGYKTYIVGTLMLVTAIAQMAGVDLPGFEGQSSMQLLMEGLAIVFLRKGLKSDAARA